MRHFFTIFWHEVRMLLLNPSTYVAAVLFLALMGFLFQGLLEEYSKSPQDAAPSVRFFYLFALPVLFMVPLLTMRSLAEERRAGTLEALLTAPVSTGEVVLGKFCASYLLYLLIWLSTLGFTFILHRFANDARFLDPGPLIGGYVFIAVSGLLFVSIGIFASALSRSQGVAGTLSFVLLFLLLFSVTWARSDLALLQQENFKPLRGALEIADVMRHRDDFTAGVVDTREIVFYCTGTALALILSVLGVEAKILRS